MLSDRAVYVLGPLQVVVEAIVETRPLELSNVVRNVVWFRP